MLNERNRALCETLQSDRFADYQVSNEFLTNSTDIIKDTYLKMLGVVLRQGDEINEYQKALFKGIIAGANVDYAFIDYLRRAKQFDETDIKVFVEVCNSLPALQYRFVLDSLILSSLSMNHKEQFELISVFCEILKIENDVVFFLASMAKAIVEMNLILYINTCYKKPDNIIDQVYYGYSVILKLYFKNVEKMTILQGFDFSKEPISIAEDEGNNGILTIIKMDFSSIIRNQCFKLSNIKNILICNCEIEGGEYPISIEKCENVKFLNTKFMNFKKRALLFESVGAMYFNNCIFSLCYNSFIRRNSFGASDCIGGVMYSSENNNGLIVMDDCQFISCGTINSKGAIAAPCISNINCKVQNSIFENCFCQNNNKFQYKNERYMFTENSTQINCKLSNSPMFNVLKT